MSSFRLGVKLLAVVAAAVTAGFAGAQPVPVVRPVQYPVSNPPTKPTVVPVYGVPGFASPGAVTTPVPVPPGTPGFNSNDGTPGGEARVSRIGVTVTVNPGGQGVTVGRVTVGSPATRLIVNRKFGQSLETLIPGDIILTCNGVAIESAEDLAKALAAVPPGGACVITGTDASNNGIPYVARVKP